MFRPESPLPGENPVPDGLWLQAVDIQLQPLAPFEERTDLYSAETCPGGECPDGKLDPLTWRAVGSRYSTDIFFQTAGGTDYQVAGKANFVVIEDRALKPGSPRKFLLFMLEDLCDRDVPGLAGVDTECWSAVKSLYRSLSRPARIDSPGAVIRALAAAYRSRDPELLRAILAHDETRGAEYVFFLSEPTELGETKWGWAEETRIHRRMFDPRNLPSDEDEVPPELWLQAVDINLQLLTAFQERTDLYSAETCPGGKCPDGKLDPMIWSALEAQYATDVFFQTADDVDYQVNGKANFVVIEDRGKRAGDAGKFLLYIWEELTPPAKSRAGATKPSTWGSVKLLYR
jgi:hypothetical protein